MAQSWTNGDGLFIRFGNLEGELTNIGEYGNYDPGSVHLVELLVTPDTLGGLPNKTHRGAKLPGANGETCFLYKAEFYVEEAFDSAGEAATLTFGLYNADGTAFDADGIDVAIAEAAIDAVGDLVVCDGALIETRLANTQPLYINSDVGVEVFTAGKGWLRVWYFIENL